MNIVDWAQIISAVAAIGSFAGSVIVYRRTLNRERKLDTIKMLSEIRMKYPKICGLSYKAKKKYIKELELSMQMTTMEKKHLLSFMISL